MTLALQNRTNNHDEFTDSNTHAPAVLIGDPRRDGRQADAAEGHDGAHESELSTSGVVECLGAGRRCRNAFIVRMERVSGNAGEETT